MSATDEPTMVRVYASGFPEGQTLDTYPCAQCGMLTDAMLLDDAGRCPPCAAERGAYLADLATERAIDARLEEEAGCPKP